MVLSDSILMDFLQNILSKQPVIFAFTTAILLLWTTIHKRNQDLKENKKVSPTPVVISIFTAIVLISNAMCSQRAANKLAVENKNQANEIRAKNDSLQAKSNALEAKSNQIIDSTGEIRRLQSIALEKEEALRKVSDSNNSLIKKYSLLQAELYDQVTGSKSFPYLTAEITDALKADQAAEGGHIPYPRLAVNIENVGGHPVNDIEIDYDLYRIHYDSTYNLLYINNLPARRSRGKEINLAALNVVHVDGITFKFIVKWKIEYVYTVQIDVSMPSADGSFGHRIINSYYTFNGIDYSSPGAFQKAILNSIP